MPSTIAGLFDERAAAERAVKHLMENGFAADAISVVAAERDAGGEMVYTTGTMGAEGVATGATSGALVGGLFGLLVGASVIALPGVGIFAAGPIAGLLTGALAGAATGGLLGGLIGLGIPESRAAVYAEGVRRGGVLVTVQTTADPLVAEQILRDHGAVDVERREEYYRSTGWSGYDSKATPLTPEEIALDRQNLASRGYATAPVAPAVASAVPTATMNEPVEVVETPAVVTTAPRVDVGGPTVAAPVGVDVSTMENYFRSDFMSRFGPQAGDYETFAPAYRWGYETSISPLYSRTEWISVEPNIRAAWESSNPGTWDYFKDAIRYAWDRARVQTVAGPELI